MFIIQIYLQNNFLLNAEKMQFYISIAFHFSFRKNLKTLRGKKVLVFAIFTILKISANLTLEKILGIVIVVLDYSNKYSLRNAFQHMLKNNSNLFQTIVKVMMKFLYRQFFSLRENKMRSSHFQMPKYQLKAEYLYVKGIFELNMQIDVNLGN